MFVTSSQLRVHQCVSDDGQESVGERVSALLPLKSLKQDGHTGDLRVLQIHVFSDQGV